MLARPATKISFEREFSALHFILNERISSIRAKNLNALLVIKLTTLNVKNVCMKNVMSELVYKNILKFLSRSALYAQLIERATYKELNENRLTENINDDRKTLFFRTRT